MKASEDNGVDLIHIHVQGINHTHGKCDIKKHRKHAHR